jgi:hypothetical protein
MAEFKLGRIRFVWKGGWSATTVYYKDDIIRHGGNTYVCLGGHTSTSSFATDLPSFWSKVSEGQEWKNDWTTDTLYKVNDVVKYGGILYIANQEHTSSNSITLGLEADQSKWDQYGESFDYKGDWNVSVRYKVNDIVKYNSTIYLCNEEHISNSTVVAGLEADQSKWDIFSKGLEWRSDWVANTRYLVNDIVKYGGQVYVCNQGHTSAGTNTLGLEADQSKWDYLHKGVEYKNDWAPSVRYKVNDLVKYGGGIWICNTHHTSQSTFTADENKWAQFVEGLEFEDSWNPGVLYQPGDFVTYGGYSYVSITNNSGLKPSDNTSDWDLFVVGFRFVGDWGDDSSLQEYIEGDVVRLNGYTYLCTDKHTGQKPPNTSYWQRLNSGIEWQDAWTDSTEYVLGDSVRYGSNSYICILAHISDETVDQNRPDQDLTGTYWNLLAAGSESAVMTTQGDLVYYSGSGPARLPIGTPGQTLKVNADATAPEWSYINRLDHIYYVSPSGTDEPAPIRGTTLDQPWKTVRYAAEQVEKGPLRPDTKYLLEVNKAFIQEEVVQWVAYQVANPTGIWVGFTNDNEALCRRDMGLILDALMWDLSHGGNIKTRLAALSYFLNGTLITAIQDEYEQLGASLEYMKEVIDAVISNLAPAANYQTLNSVPSPISQTIDASYVEEPSSQTLLEGLLDIIINAVEAQSITNLPVARNPNNTIFVKTGTFNETLPIIVPENTAVVGDELRSTRIEPAGVLIPSGDTPYTLAALNHLKIFIDGIIIGSSVGKTPGNPEDWVDTNPVVGDSEVAAAAAELFQQIIDYIDYGVNGATGDSTVPVTTGTNTPRTDTEWTYAVEALEKNRNFIVEEAAAWIAQTYPGYTYNVALCKRDVNRYIDAIKYDLIYAGNYKSLLAARYYVNAVNGSLLEDMFYLRNGTGLRNCTVAGLTGTLSAPNIYGTRRPTAGAYASLDPGWGVNDERVWILTRSPYVQNVTTFGTGCIGLKVDGDLHAGGNDSIVANDFTQVISDGIGAWVTNLARAELVSVFSYYAHIGYLAEDGGKIRATNGNSSYGNFGCVAEGIDITEIPVTGTVTNRFFDAIIDSVFTDGDDILVFEYLNAGVNYTTGGTTFTVTGEGFGAQIDDVNTVNGGVFEVRLLDTDVDQDSTPDTGGSGYITSTNVAQSGTATSITIANTDTATSGQYTGMAIFIVAGRGAGQYGFIDSYNSGTKAAQIRKMSDGTSGWDHLVVGTSIETSLDGSTQYVIEPRVTFTAPPSTLYADTAKGRAYVEDGSIIKITIWDPGSGYVTAPTMTVTDPNNIIDVPHDVRIGDGVLTQPTWINRGTAFTTAEATVTGDGFADLYQPGEFVRVENLSGEPLPGSSVSFGHLPGQFFKLVFVRELAGSPGTYSAQFQISPKLSISDAPEHNESLNLRLRYSQVRLTGHDFLDIGTGNFANTNYPDNPLTDPISTNEVIESGGGRVFYTSTDQDGNFRVGDLFSVEQATGVATLNADAFNISGLQELSLGELSLGGVGATITEFSTDGTFTANSDNIVPTQKAIRTYITSQIGGGAATLNVNSITAGQILISGQQITTTTGNQINVLTKLNLTRGVDGVPIALNFFLLG